MFLKFLFCLIFLLNFSGLKSHNKNTDNYSIGQSFRDLKLSKKNSLNNEINLFLLSSDRYGIITVHSNGLDQSHLEAQLAIKYVLPIAKIDALNIVKDYTANRLNYRYKATSNIFSKKSEQTFNERSYSGPMGMGLSKSYETKDEKVCIYNLIEGQKTIRFDKKILKCPKRPPK